jgi:hypothetical protein
MSTRRTYDAAVTGTRRRAGRDGTGAALVCTGHFPVPSAGTVDRWSGGFRFRPWDPGTGPAA